MHGLSLAGMKLGTRRRVQADSVGQPSCAHGTHGWVGWGGGGKEEEIQDVLDPGRDRPAVRGCRRQRRRRGRVWSEIGQRSGSGADTCHSATRGLQV